MSEKAAHGKRYTELKRKRAIALLRKRTPVPVVARAVGASQRTIRRWRKSAGLEPGDGRRYDREAIRKALEKKTVAQVCAKFGCSERYARAVKSGELEA